MSTRSRRFSSASSRATTTGCSCPRRVDCPPAGSRRIPRCSRTSRSTGFMKATCTPARGPCYACSRTAPTSAGSLSMPSMMALTRSAATSTRTSSATSCASPRSTTTCSSSFATPGPPAMPMVSCATASFSITAARRRPSKSSMACRTSCRQARLASLRPTRAISSMPTSGPSWSKRRGSRSLRFTPALRIARSPVNH